MNLSSDFVYMHMKGCRGRLTHPHFTPGLAFEWRRLAGTDAGSATRVAQALATIWVCRSRPIPQPPPGLRVFKLP